MPPKVAGQTYCLQKLERATTTVDVPKTLLKCQSLSDQGSLGTHRGPFGAIPPTGNAFKVRMTAFFVFDGTTLTCERIYFDTLTMLRQLLGGLDFKKPTTYLILLKALRGITALSPAKPAD